jgi:hypothetical protein
MLSRLVIPATFCALLLLSGQLVRAELIQFQSPEKQIALLELYTSEGCSSCPPAEVWLSGLKKSPRLWQEFVPVAFHVDYWDNLGWKDRFGAKEYSDRQRQYANHWHNRSVYTPGFVEDGREWRGWLQHGALPRTYSKPAGVLAAHSEDGRHWTLRFHPFASGGDSSYDVHAVLLGFDLASQVKAGENQGRRLDHDFVVLTLVKALSRKEGDIFRAEVQFDSKALSSRRLAFAAWVTQSGNPEPVQALGGWLPSPVAHEPFGTNRSSQH